MVPIPEGAFVMPAPLTIPGTWNSYPLQLKAGQVTYVTVRCITSMEIVNLDRKGAFWARFDADELPEAFKPNNFIIFLSRRFPTNRGTRTVALLSDEDKWVSVEGTIY